MINLIKKSLKTNKSSLIQSRKKSCVAILLRERENNLTEVLYILRAFNPRDRWSGHVAFPGGHTKENEEGIDTAIRETREEIGIDLKDKFDFVGELDHTPIRFSRRGHSISPFVFEQKNPQENLDFKIEVKEVEALRWVPLSSLCEENVELTAIKHDIPFLFMKLKASFPSIPLINNSKSVLSPAEITSKPFNLWGLTLQITSNLVAHLKSKDNKDKKIIKRQLGWPAIHFENRFFQTINLAVSGGLEILAPSSTRTPEIFSQTNNAFMSFVAVSITLVAFAINHFNN